jgi:RNA recognition motif-containing protein
VVPPATNMYPPNCFVFVRNIHPETNKTTLRTFFAKAVEVKEAINYVNFNKGMGSVRRFCVPIRRAFVVQRT